MSFLTPLFFLGALATAVPIYLHMIKRERSRRIEFPSLMYLRRINKKTIRYQKLRHLLLLLLRVLAFLFLALAFMRPFREVHSVTETPGKERAVHVLLLDNSLSMGYQDRWDRAKEAASNVVRNAEQGDEFALLFFSDRTDVASEATADKDKILGQINTQLELSDHSTRYGQALKLAERVALEGKGSERVLYLISDFQSNGWTTEEQRFRLGATIRLEPIDVGSEEYSNLAWGETRVLEDPGAGRFRKIRSTLLNFGNQERKNVLVTLDLDGKQIGQTRVDIRGAATTVVEFDLAPLSSGMHPLVLELEDSNLPGDNRFHMTLESRGKIAVLSVEARPQGRTGKNTSFFLRHALNLSALSPYRLSTGSPQDLQEFPARGLVIWNNVSGGNQATQQQLREFVQTGGGLVIIVANSASATDFNQSFGEWIPVKVVVNDTAAVARRRTAGPRYLLLTDIRTDHPIFKPFSEPNSGNFSTAKFFHHVPLAAAEDARVLASFDNGDPALIAFSSGMGRVLILSFSASDEANDLPLKAVFAPFWHQMLDYLDSFQAQHSWVLVGDTIFPKRILSEVLTRQGNEAAVSDRAVAVVDPARQRVPHGIDNDATTVDWSGFYEIRAAGLNAAVAVNVIPRESNLEHGDAEAQAAAWTTFEASAVPAGSEEKVLSLEDQERPQRIWLFLLVGVLVFFVGEGILGRQAIMHTD